MRRNEPIYYCLACHVDIVFSDDEINPKKNIKLGWSLDETTEPHVCGDCWAKMTTEQQLEACRRWRLDKASKVTLDAIAALCRAACDGWHIPGLGDHPGRN